MPCAFHYVRPRPYHDLDPGCQFEKLGDNLITVDEQDWCPYHCPMMDKEGKPTEKVTWNKAKLKAFHETIDQQRTKALKNASLLDLTGVVFPTYVDYKKLEFPKVLFDRCIFSKGAWFGETRFGGDAWFGEATFSGDASFQNTTFIESAQFSRATFSCMAWFDRALFSDGAMFLEATFNGIAWFYNTTFNGDAWFEGATFSQAAHFESSGKKKDQSEVLDNTFSYAHFTDAMFSSFVFFQNRQFLEFTSFEKCTFKQAPVFHGCTLHQDTIFPPREYFHDVTSECAAQAYRTLKLAMEEKRARHEEAMFYALEQESRRNRTDTPRSEKLVSYLYKRTADYGEKFLRPLAWLAGTTTACFILYVILTILQDPSWGTVGLSVEFTIEQLVRPLSVWIKGGGIDMKELLENNELLLFCVKLIATFQAVTSLSLITLFILALRRRFKLR